MRNHSDNLASSQRFLEKAKTYEGGVLGMASKVRILAAATAAAVSKLMMQLIPWDMCACSGSGCFAS
jgi:hypothetical protein